MSQRGIRINDWFAQICLGIFFFCIGMIFLTFFISVDPNAIASMTVTDWIGVLFVMLIPTGLMDLGFWLVIGGWKGRHKASTIDLGVSDLNINNPLGVSADGGVASGEQKTIRAISGGISVFYTISLWIQRLAGIAAAIFALCFTAYWWITSIHDITPGKTPLNAFMLLTLGLVLISYLIIIYIKLLRKPRTNPNAP